MEWFYVNFISSIYHIWEINTSFIRFIKCKVKVLSKMLSSLIYSLYSNNRKIVHILCVAVNNWSCVKFYNDKEYEGEFQSMGVREINKKLREKDEKIVSA